MRVFATALIVIAGLLLLAAAVAFYFAAYTHVHTPENWGISDRTHQHFIPVLEEKERERIEGLHLRMWISLIAALVFLVGGIGVLRNAPKRRSFTADKFNRDQAEPPVFDS